MASRLFPGGRSRPAFPLDGSVVRFVDDDAAKRKGRFKIFDLVEGSGLFAFLASRSAPAAIVADERALALLRSVQGHADAAVLYSTSEIGDKGILNPVAGPYYVLTEDDEHMVKSRLRFLFAAAGLEPRIFGAFNDVLPILKSGRSKPFDTLESAWSAYHATTRYMVLCAPRSGSEFLTRSLEADGIGAPREHITPHVYQPLAAVNGARPGGLDFTYWLVKLIHNASVNGIFGTKIISHYHRSLMAALHPEEGSFFDDAMAGACLLYLYRSDKLLQALSLDRARITGFWHSYDAGNMTSYRQIAGAWEYDFIRISNAIRYLAREEQYTCDLWRRCRGEKSMSICYEAIDVEAVKRQLLECLGKAPVQPGTKVATTRLRDERTAEYAERFRVDYRKRYVGSDVSTHLPLRTFLESDELRVLSETP